MRQHSAAPSLPGFAFPMGLSQPPTNRPVLVIFSLPIHGSQLPTTSCNIAATYYDKLNGITLAVTTFLVYMGALWCVPAPSQYQLVVYLFVCVVPEGKPCAGNFLERTCVPPPLPLHANRVPTLSLAPPLGTDFRLVGLLIMRHIGWRTDRMAEYSRLMTSRFLLFLTLVFTPVTQTVLGTFNCVKINNEHYLVHDLSLKCYDSRHWAYVKASIFWTILYPLGVPSLYLALFLYYKIPAVARDIRRTALLVRTSARRGSEGTPFFFLAQQVNGGWLNAGLSCLNLFFVVPSLLGPQRGLVSLAASHHEDHRVWQNVDVLAITESTISDDHLDALMSTFAGAAEGPATQLDGMHLLRTAATARIAAFDGGRSIGRYRSGKFAGAGVFVGGASTPGSAATSHHHGGGGRVAVTHDSSINSAAQSLAKERADRHRHHHHDGGAGPAATSSAFSASIASPKAPAGGEEGGSSNTRSPKSPATEPPFLNAFSINTAGGDLAGGGSWTRPSPSHFGSERNHHRPPPLLPPLHKDGSDIILSCHFADAENHLTRTAIAAEREATSQPASPRGAPAAPATLRIGRADTDVDEAGSGQDTTKTPRRFHSGHGGGILRNAKSTGASFFLAAVRGKLASSSASLGGGGMETSASAGPSAVLTQHGSSSEGGTSSSPHTTIGDSEHHRRGQHRPLSNETIKSSSPLPPMTRAQKIEWLVRFARASIVIPPLAWGDQEADPRLIGARSAISLLYSDLQTSTWWWLILEVLQKLFLTGLLQFIAPRSNGEERSS